MIKQRLELDWIGKDDEPKLEPRILIPSADKSMGDRDSKNMLIHGDNLLALKSLEQDYANRIKLCFIDPPYNTGSAFKHYDDGLEHSLWLTLIRDRLTIIRRLLADNGSLWITLDDNEHAYCKVLCDEIFGRQNFVASLVWEKKVSPANDAKWFSGDHDHILVYAKNKEVWRPNRLEKSEEQLQYYKNPDNDPRGPWNSAAYTCAKSADERPNLYYAITNPNTGEEIWPNRNRVWAYDKSTHQKNVENNLIYWGKDGAAKMPRIKKFLSSSRNVVPRSVWSYEETGHTQEARLESMKLFPDDPFPTPKPEKLIKKIIEVASAPSDLVLDSFAGSGTTGAVAHKMNRNWIMIEMGDHCHTHILPRMKKVIDGTDTGGVTSAVNWTGGGGFKYFEMAPSLLQKDTHGNWIISPKYNAVQLAEAVCKHEGFKFWPDPSTYWKQGSSTEKDFIFVTTEFLTADRIERIAKTMKPDETLLICAKAFRVPTNKYPNITIKKIPQMLLGRCEFGRDDYSLNLKEQIQEEMDLDEADI